MLEVLHFVCLKALLSHHSPLWQPSPPPERGCKTPLHFHWQYSDIYMSAKGEVMERMSVVSYHRQMLGVWNHPFLALEVKSLINSGVNGNQALWLTAGDKRRKITFTNSCDMPSAFPPLALIGLLHQDCFLLFCHVINLKKVKEPIWGHSVRTRIGPRSACLQSSGSFHPSTLDTQSLKRPNLPVGTESRRAVSRLLTSRGKVLAWVVAVTG